MNPWIAIAIAAAGAVAVMIGIILSFTVIGMILGIPLALVGGVACGWGFVKAIRGFQGEATLIAVPVHPSVDGTGLPADQGPGTPSPDPLTPGVPAPQDDPLAANPIARTSRRIGFALLITQAVSLCIGFVPLVNLLNLVVIPSLFVLDGIAIVTGILGVRRAREVDGIGKGASLTGIAIGAGHILLVVGAITAMVVLFGGVALLQLMMEAR